MEFAEEARIPSFSRRDSSCRLKLFALPALLFAIPEAIPAAAQYAASLGGTVEDPTGAVVPGATVTAQSEGAGLTRTAPSQPNGEFLFSALPIANDQGR